MTDVEVITESGTGLLTDPSWDAFVATAGTIFHSRRLLRAWWHHRQLENSASRLLTTKVVDGDGVIGLCAFEFDGDTLAFAGGRDVVDYMGPIAAAGREKEVAAALVHWMFEYEDASWSRAEFAGMVQDDPAAQAFIDEVLRVVPSAVVAPYDQAPRIAQAPEGYLALLNSKRRADILRKRNRLVEAVGELELVDSTSATILESAQRLLAWKAAADPAMSDFVLEYGDYVRDMLTALCAVDAARVVELHADGRPLAAVIVLTHRDTASIYNMAYDLELTAGGTGLAPGVVLISLLIERCLNLGLHFDFLKGAQDYKLRLGGVPVDILGLSIERLVLP